MILAGRNCVRIAKARSWVFNISYAKHGDDITIEEISPSWRCINALCFWANFLRVWWGWETIKWCIFPTIGSFDGEGGSFFVVLDLFHRFPIPTIKARNREKAKKLKGSSIAGDSLCSSYIATPFINLIAIDFNTYNCF